MQAERTGLFRLLVILIIFGVSVLLINKNTRQSILETQIDVHHTLPENIVHFSPEQIYDHMYSLLLSHNISLVLRVINQCNAQYAYDLVEKIVCDFSLPLTDGEKIEIICGVMAHSIEKKWLAHKLCNLFLMYPDLYTQTPLLLTFVKIKRSNLISFFLHWLESDQKQKDGTCIIQALVYEALRVAIAENDCVATEVILNKKIHINKEVASNLLWCAVKHNKNELFIPLFVRCAHADVNYCYDGKRTLLIQAVENKNIEMVRALLEEGATVDSVPDEEVGSALSIAQKGCLDEIIALLV